MQVSCSLFCPSALDAPWSLCLDIPFLEQTVGMVVTTLLCASF